MELIDKRLFIADFARLEEEFATIPDVVIEEAFAEAWNDRPPRISIEELRKRILAALRSGARVPNPRIVPILEAARELGIHPRTLRRRIERGEVEGKHLSSGALAVELPAKPKRWLLVPHRLRPDPRVVQTP